MSTKLTPDWPATPYKGLGFYTEADASLFAGRDEDIQLCSATLAEWKTRVMLLHGSTGCGKSSFLRAGLVPYLEDNNTGIAFARTDSGDPASLLFVRSTAEPLVSLADALYRFAGRTVSRPTPDGVKKINLRDALPHGGNMTTMEFRSNFGRKPDVLLDILEKLSQRLPETLVLIIDQGEEVLTLNKTFIGEEWRNQFFGFLSEFGKAQFDLKLLIALRTEYLGRFFSHIRRNVRGPRIVELFLNELSEEQIKEAVERPTIKTEVGMLGAPFSQYQFSFDDGVVDTIVAELESVAGAKLPVLQIVCSALFDLVSARPKPRRIMLEDLQTIGGVQGSVERFLDNQLIECGKLADLAPLTCDREAIRWKEALHRLARPQPDGTVTTDIKPESALRNELLSSKLDFAKTIDRLTASLIMRTVDVVDQQTRETVRCFGLGHDILGLVLRNWKVRYDAYLLYGRHNAGFIGSVWENIADYFTKSGTAFVATFTLLGVSFGGFLAWHGLSNNIIEGKEWVLVVVLWSIFGVLSNTLISLAYWQRHNLYNPSEFVLVIPKLFLAPLLALVVVATLRFQDNSLFQKPAWFIQLFAFILGYKTQQIYRQIGNVASSVLSSPDAMLSQEKMTDTGKLLIRSKSPKSVHAARKDSKNAAKTSVP